MNKKRRKLLEDALDFIERATAKIECVREEEEEAYENLPEWIRSSEKWEKIQQNSWDLIDIENSLATLDDDLLTLLDNN